MREETNPVNWFEIYVDNIDRAKKFYETVLAKEMFDLPTPEGVDSKMVVFEGIENAPNATGALVQMTHVKAGGNSTIVYFTCKDCEIEQKRVERARGKVLNSKFSIGEYGFIALCLDTEENCFGLHSMK